MDMMTTFIEWIKTTISKLRNWVSKEDRDKLEFDICDLNIQISGAEYDYDIWVIKLDKVKDDEYNLVKAEIKTDAGIKRHLDSKFITEQQILDMSEAEIKKQKRLHSWFIRIAEHIKSNQIQEMSDKNRNGF